MILNRAQKVLVYNRYIAGKCTASYLGIQWFWTEKNTPHMLGQCHTIASAHKLITFMSYGSTVLKATPSSLSAWIWAEFCNLGNDTRDVMHSEGIISSVQHCFKWPWQLQFIPAMHSCSLYVHGCVLPHMIKCCEFWPCITRHMKAIKKTFHNSHCQYSHLTEITEIIILNEI